MKRNALFLLLSAIIMIGSACTGFKKLDKIKMADYFSLITCEIPLIVPYASANSEYLHTDDTIEELKLKLDEISKEKENFTTEYLQYNALMIVYEENSKKALYLLQKLSDTNIRLEYKNMYRFSDFSTYLYTSEFVENSHKIPGINGIPIPHHLLNNKAGSCSENQEILVKGYIDEFEGFYKTFKKYYTDYPMEIIREENKLILKNIPVTVNVEGDNGKLQKESRLLKQATLTFSKNNNDEPIVVISLSYKL